MRLLLEGGAYFDLCVKQMVRHLLEGDAYLRLNAFRANTTRESIETKQNIAAKCVK